MAPKCNVSKGYRLTSPTIARPWSASTRLATDMCAMRRRVASVALPMCGSTTAARDGITSTLQPHAPQLGNESSGCDGGSGSGEVTSSPAACQPRGGNVGTQSHAYPYPLGAECLVQRILVHNAAPATHDIICARVMRQCLPGGVDENGRGLHEGQCARIDQVWGV